MTLRTLVVWCCALLASGCDSDVQDDISGSFFFLDNKTEYPLRIEWKERERPDAEPRSFGPVPSGSLREFTSDGRYSLFSPEPSDVFSSVALFRTDTGARVYVQEPPNDDAWEKEVIQVRLGELRTQFTLTVREADLTPTP